MELQSTQRVLRRAIDQLSQPFVSPMELRTISMKLDAIAGSFLGSSYVVEKLGSSRASALSSEDPTLADILREIGGDEFMKAAACAESLRVIGRSSLVDFGTADDWILEANDAREKLHNAFVDLLTDVDE